MNQSNKTIRFCSDLGVHRKWHNQNITSCSSHVVAQSPLPVAPPLLPPRSTKSSSNQAVLKTPTPPGNRCTTSCNSPAAPSTPQAPLPLTTPYSLPRSWARNRCRTNTLPVTSLPSTRCSSSSPTTPSPPQPSRTRSNSCPRQGTMPAGPGQGACPGRSATPAYNSTGLGLGTES